MSIVCGSCVPPFFYYYIILQFIHFSASCCTLASSVDDDFVPIYEKSKQNLNMSRSPTAWFDGFRNLPHFLFAQKIFEVLKETYYTINATEWI